MKSYIVMQEQFYTGDHTRFPKMSKSEHCVLEVFNLVAEMNTCQSNKGKKILANYGYNVMGQVKMDNMMGQVKMRGRENK